MVKSKLKTTCNICGDKAVGRNFGSITCESCKVFFRRHSLNYKNYICLFDNKCDINQNTRSFCRKCRLTKCFSLGMKIEFIQNEEQKKSRRLLIERNRRLKNKKLITNSSDESNCSVVSEDESTGSSGCDSDDSFSKIFDCNQKVMNQLSTYNAFVNISQKIHSIKCDKPLDLGHKLLLGHRIDIISPLNPINTYGELNDIECKRLDDLHRASQVFRYPATQPIIKVNNICEYYKLWGNRLELDTQDIIKYTKNMTIFSDICLNDKISLIKYGSMEIIVTRGNSLYDYKNEIWNQIIDDNCNSFLIPLDLLKREKRNLHGVYKQYFKKFLPEWGFDQMLLDLMTAIVLFSPKRPHLIHKDTIIFQQKLYIYLMERYLMATYGNQWITKMANFMNTLTDLKIVSQIEIQNGIEEYLTYFGPLFREIIG
ncbi:nuclear hormone receptor HR96-like [Oppia nitens]|uniref:nuclear hormone receptor HR96-like n=1 Tax=Oppia nitens TaxID=1686743 RepID=UPI0023D9DCFF|nr:nuclear hormone receptor HR96-like [Oppia nitens]